MDTTHPRKSGGIPEVSCRFGLRVENEQADAGRDGRTRLARETTFPGAIRDRDIFIFLVQLTTSRIDNLSRLVHALLYIISDDHTTYGLRPVHDFFLLCRFSNFDMDTVQ